MVGNEQTRYLTVAEAARWLNVHPNTVRNWVRQGVLRSSRVAGARAHRFEAEEVDRVARSRGAVVAPLEEAQRRIAPELADATLLDAWSDRLEARGLLPKLIRRLLASMSGVQDLSMRAGEGIGSAGWDGRARAETASHWVPEGLSHWELGTGANPRKKAQADYNKRTTATGDEERAHTTLVIVTSRRWPGARDWEQKRREEATWRNVRVIDADDLEGWLEATPGAHYWFSEQLGLRPHHVRTLGAWWDEFTNRTQPPLPPGLLLAGRGEATEQLRAFVQGDPGVLAIRAGWRDEAIGFLAASLHATGSDQTPADHPCVVVLGGDVWRQICLAPTPMVLVPAFEDADVGAALAGGHHVVVPLGPQDIARGAAIELAPPDRSDARDAWVESGLSFEQSDKLARLSRRSVAAVVRQFARDPRMARPAWGKRPASDVLAPLMLIGTWAESETDHKVITRVVDRPWTDVEHELNAWLATGDPPFIQSGGQWHLTSSDEAFLVLEGALTLEQLASWQEATLEVLSETDPALELEAEERMLAGVRDIGRTYSTTLRQGLSEGLALIGARGDRSFGDGMTGAEHAQLIVRDLLQRANNDGTGRLWRSLASELPLLAEAAPQAFLDAISIGLSGDPPLLATMFRDHEKDTWLYSTSPHTGLLWALENLCWSPVYIFDAAEALARLSEVDPGGRLSNRPSASLTTVLLPWMPNTAAPLRDRLDLLRQIRDHHPDIGWRLLMALMPTPHGTASPTHSPRFREDWKPDRRGVLVTEWLETIAGVVDQALEDAGHDSDRWAELLGHLGPLSPDLRSRLLDALEGIANPDALSAEARLTLWEHLTKETGRHRSFPETQWSMDNEALSRMERLATRLEPTEAVERHARLFDWMPDLPGVDPTDHHAYDKALGKARAEAVREALDRDGVAGLARLARESQLPDRVGWGAAEVAGDELVDKILPLFEADEPQQKLATAWVGAMYSRQGPDWLSGIAKRLHGGAEDAQLMFLLAVPGGPEVWNLAETFGESVTNQYWRSVNPLWVEEAAAATGVKRLLAHGQPRAAIALLAGSLHRSEGRPAGLTSELVEGVLDAALEAQSLNDVPGPSLGYEVGVLLDFLDRPDTNPQTLLRFEWAFFQILNEDREPRALYAALSEDPKRFVELVCLVYRGKNERRRKLDEEAAALAHNAWSVLHAWRRVPGRRDDGTIDSDHLRRWVNEAREQLGERDRADIGDEQIGQLLSASPPGQDDAWPAEPVRDLIEDIGNRELETGIHLGLVNSRGVTTRGVYDGGKQERALAAKYRGWAEATASRWRRTSRVLRDVADSYERDARREDAEAERRASFE